MGGHLLLRALVERKPALDAAVLVAPMIVVNSAPIPAWLAPEMADAMCRLGLGPVPMWKAPPALQRPGSQRQRNLTGSRERYEDEAWWWEREPGWNLGAPSWAWMRAAFRSAAAAFTPERLAGVELPVLLLGAERDRLVSAAAIRAGGGRAARRRARNVSPTPATKSCARPIRSGCAALARIDAFLDRRGAVTDVAIVGAGMAGASLAAELAGARLGADARGGEPARLSCDRPLGRLLVGKLWRAADPAADQRFGRRCSPPFLSAARRDPPRRRGGAGEAGRAGGGISGRRCSSRWTAPRSRRRSRASGRAGTGASPSRAAPTSTSPPSTPPA